MVEVKVKRVGKDEIESKTNIEGKSDDIIIESFYAIKALFHALGEEDVALKVNLAKAMAENDEWFDHETDSKEMIQMRSLDDVLGRKATERRFN